MDHTVPVHVAPTTYAKLQKLAVLAGSEAAAVDRLIDHWERSQVQVPPVSMRSKPSATAKTFDTWRTPNGDLLPVGAPLFAPYAGKTYEAVVVKGGIEFQGRVYDSPTSAGRAVKKRARGHVGSSASTNGREFWRVRDPSSGQLVPIKDLNPGPQLDANELLREIMDTPNKSAA